jgi:plastocyanin
MYLERLALTSLVALALAACGGDGGGTGPVDPTPPVQKPPAEPVASATVAAGANSNDFSPSDVLLKLGGTVTWTFGARPHNVIFGQASGAPADIPVTSNTQASRTFNTAGTFSYDCTLHAGMSGTVRVQ